MMDLSDMKRIKLLLDILSEDPDLLKFIAEQLALAEQNNDPLDEFTVELNEWLADKSRALSSVG
tara:strand:+ start:347 stop:538 length:192 start_codon:yes stop_codon:yes gene_type:complete